MSKLALGKLEVEVIKGEREEEVRLSSREVAEMLDVARHGDMIRKIESIGAKINERKDALVEYWVETTYKDSKGEDRKEYLITKAGCELLAHKSTGKKGIAFTLAYMKRFNEMEKALQEVAAKSIFEKAVPSYMIEDPIERAECWIKEQQEKRAILEAKEKLSITNEKLKTESDDKTLVIEDMSPKAAAFDLFLNSDKTYTVNAVAKGMAIKSMGRNNMFKYLRLKGVLMDGTREPYARYISAGYVKAVEETFIGDGNKERTALVIRFTPKGVEWLYKSLKKDGYIKTRSLEDMVNDLKNQK